VFSMDVCAYAKEKLNPKTIKPAIAKSG